MDSQGLLPIPRMLSPILQLTEVGSFLVELHNLGQYRAVDSLIGGVRMTQWIPNNCLGIRDGAQGRVRMDY